MKRERQGLTSEPEHKPRETPEERKERLREVIRDSGRRRGLVNPVERLQQEAERRREVEELDLRGK